MAERPKVQSVLAERIAAGQADPISDVEREIAQNLRAAYERRFGTRRAQRRRASTSAA